MGGRKGAVNIQSPFPALVHFPARYIAASLSRPSRALSLALGQGNRCPFTLRSPLPLEPPSLRNEARALLVQLNWLTGVRQDWAAKCLRILGGQPCHKNLKLCNFMPVITAAEHLLPLGRTLEPTILGFQINQCTYFSTVVFLLMFSVPLLHPQLVGWHRDYFAS